MFVTRALRHSTRLSVVALALLGGAGRGEAQSVDTVMTLGGAGGALDLLRHYSPEYKVSLAQANFASEDVLRSWGAWLPTVTARAIFQSNEAARRTAVDDFGISQVLDDPIQASSKNSYQALELNWLLFNGGQRFFDQGASRADARAADLAAVATLVRLESEVEAQYYEALKEQEQARLARELLAARARDLEVARARFRIAAVAQTDVLQAEIEVSRQQLSALRAEQAARAARRELSALIGIADEVGYGLRDESEIFDPSVVAVEDLIALARRANPSLERRAAEVQARKQGLWASRGTWLPDVNLSATFSRSENLGPDGNFFTLNPRDTGTNFRLTFSYPLINGFQKKWETGQQAARLQEAEQRKRGEVIQMEKDVRNLYEELGTRHRAYQIQLRNVEQARELVRMATERYRIGATSYAELQQAQDRETEAERGLIESRYDFMRTLARLKAAVGAPITEVAS